MIRIVVLGPPRTKKTSNQGMRTGSRCPACGLRKGPIRVFPSKAWRRWVNKAAILGPDGKLWWQRLPDRPYRLKAIFYRDADRGDLVGYEQGLADFLETRNIISDDKWIRSWDGSRLEVDHRRPRVEVEIEESAA